jgi:hypothetical protein
MVHPDEQELWDGLCGMCDINGCEPDDATVAVLSPPMSPDAPTPEKP